MTLKFLTAQWRNLCLFNYAVDPEQLAPYLPAGLSLDLRDDNAFVSLVAFDFLDTRVLGVPWPGYRDFPEINLRFYVRQNDRRGVMFIREYVPQRFVAWMARTLYNEPYQAAPMTSQLDDGDSRITVTHSLTVGACTNTLTVTGSKPSRRPGHDSEEHHFKEHQWGFGQTRKGALLQYEVQHPVWDVYDVVDYSLDWDWAAVYGPQWADLTQAEPRSVLLAVGSEVAVMSPTRPEWTSS